MDEHKTRCAWCGEYFTIRYLDSRYPYHDHPKPTRQLCRGSNKLIIEHLDYMFDRLSGKRLLRNKDG